MIPSTRRSSPNLGARTRSIRSGADMRGNRTPRGSALLLVFLGTNYAAYRGIDHPRGGHGTDAPNELVADESNHRDGHHLFDGKKKLSKVEERRLPLP